MAGPVLGTARRSLSVSVLLALTLFALALVFSPFQSARAQTADLILSEYVDGSISNQAIEIYNGTGAPVNLNNYRLELYSNTNTTPNATVTLSGSLANDATWVIVSPGAGPQLTARADQLSNVISFNGNDSVVLRRNGAVVDSFGRIGENPPNGWQGGGVRTFEVTLRRKANVCAGRTNPNTPFDPSQEWNQFPQDVFDGLGGQIGPSACALRGILPAFQRLIDRRNARLRVLAGW
jgi:predicted extracellular nuclease